MSQKEIILSSYLKFIDHDRGLSIDCSFFYANLSLKVAQLLNPL